jgi:DNA-binding CsgD family transcriptional regulator
VERHVENLSGKLDMSGRSQLVAYAAAYLVAPR